jgi:hypothetical protein
MCDTCGNIDCECLCENCGCNGTKISSDCIISSVDSPVIEFNEGDSITQFITNVNNYLTELYQTIENITNGAVEVERGSGAPSSTPTGTEPIVYVNEANGNLYTWNGAAWSLVVSTGGSGIELSISDGVFSTSVTYGMKFDVAPASGVNAAYTVEPKLISKPYVPLSGLSNVVGINPITSGPSTGQIRLRWDDSVEMDGQIFIAPASLVVASCYNTPRTVQLYPIGGLPVIFRPTTASAPMGAKIFPTAITLYGTGASMAGCEVGSLSYTYLAELIVWNDGKVDLRINDHRYNDDLNSGATFSVGVVNLGHIKYHTN